MLSQAEIDALLDANSDAEPARGEASAHPAQIVSQAGPASRGEPAATDRAASGKEIRSYNFWSPERFSKEQTRAVELVHENLAERLTTSMSSYLRSDFRPRIAHAEQGGSDDFLKDLPPGTLYHIMALDPLPGRMILVISADITSVVLERLLGGAGPSDRKPRPLTDIGQSLIRGTVEHMLNDLKAAWSRLVPLEPRLEDSTTNQQWVMMMMGGARVMFIAFEVSLQGVTGSINLYLPFSMLRPVASALNPAIWISGREAKHSDEAARRKNLGSLRQLPVMLRVVLGEAELTLGDVLGLRPGDVIPLDTRTRQELRVCVGDRQRFTGRVGTVGRRLAVQIAGVTAPAAGAD
jgi:flagellar motor switch protein FliM